jgi:hypothetical protein
MLFQVNIVAWGQTLRVFLIFVSRILYSRCPLCWGV